LKNFLKESKTTGVLFQKVSIHLGYKKARVGEFRHPLHTGCSTIFFDAQK